MLTDMVGYAALGQKNGPLSLVLVEEQRTLIRPICEDTARGGQDQGDAFPIEFPSALEGIWCAYDIQRRAREIIISLPPDGRIHLRRGVHLGEVTGSYLTRASPVK
jgi:class 3 adenylate cyclase